MSVLLGLLMLLSVDDKARLVTDPIPLAEEYVAEIAHGKRRVVGAFGGLQSGKTLHAADGVYLALYGDDPL